MALLRWKSKHFRYSKKMLLRFFGLCQFVNTQEACVLEWKCVAITQHSNRIFWFVFSWVFHSHVFSHTVHKVQDDCQYSAFIFYTNCMTCFIFLHSLSVIEEMGQRTWPYHY